MLAVERRGLNVISTWFSLGQMKIRRAKQTSAGRLETCDVGRVRNIGVAAHIDAGKTTTTERMLYLSGATGHLGDVDSGDTVTDFMDQERERGITISSAAITFNWRFQSNLHRINLIDTPGHVDFTVEVERCLRVLDGTVTVLDGSAGVEAQTMTVWRQTNKFSIPTIFYVNKMDKPNASLERSVESVEQRLSAPALVLQQPVKREGRLEGVVDLVRMRRLRWPLDATHEQRHVFNEEPLAESQLLDESRRAREQLLADVAEHDRQFAVALFSADSVETLDVENEILPAIRRITLARTAFPVLCGSSFENIAVHPLIDSVCAFLPSPADRQHDFQPFYQHGLCALAFKIAHDEKIGALTYVRVYSGNLKVGQSIYNVNRAAVEPRITLYTAFGDELKETTEVSEGGIAVVGGLLHTTTGDTLTDRQETAVHAAERHRALHKDRHVEEADEHLEHICHVDADERDEYVLLAGVEAPEPVFFCAVEAPSLRDAKRFEAALAQLRREDPSLTVKENSETGQIRLGGMGQLHLEIVRDRLKNEYKLDVFLGKLEVAYRECPQAVALQSEVLEEMLSGRRQSVLLTLRVEPHIGSGPLTKVWFEHHHQQHGHKHQRHGHGKSLAETISVEHRQALLDGCKNACLNGPKLSFPIQDLTVTLVEFEVTKGASSALVNACAGKCLKEALKKANAALLEPTVRVEVTCRGESAVAAADKVSRELVRRRAELADIAGELHGAGNEYKDWKTVTAEAPLSEMDDFVTAVRKVSHGREEMHMALSGYQTVSDKQFDNLLLKWRGYSTTELS